MISYKNRYDIGKGKFEGTWSLGFLKSIFILRSVGAEATLGVFSRSFGWIIGGEVGVESLLTSLSKYMGMWIRLNCFGNTLESFYNLTNKS